MNTRPSENVIELIVLCVFWYMKGKQKSWPLTSLCVLCQLWRMPSLPEIVTPGPGADVHAAGRVVAVLPVEHVAGHAQTVRLVADQAAAAQVW